MSAQFQSVFFDANPLPAWICEPKTLKVLQVNRAVVSTFGFSRTQWLNVSLREKIQNLQSIENKSRVHATLVSRKGIPYPLLLSANDLTVRKKKLLFVVASPNESKEETPSTNFKYLFENNPLPMWIYDTETYEFLEVNSTASRKYGYTREEFRSKTILDIRPVDDRKRLISTARTLPEFNHSGSWRHILKDGRIIDVDVYSHSFVHHGRKARLIVVNDITERKKAEEENKRLAAIVSRTSNSVILTDQNGNTTWVNDGFERITGYKLREVYGKKPGAILQGSGTDKETIAKMRNALAKKEGFKAEVLNYSKTGKKYWVDIEVMPLKNDQGEVTGFMAIESDITMLKTAVREMLKSQMLLQTIMDNAPLLVFLKNLKGQYTFYNTSFKNLYPGNYQKKILTDYDLFPKEQADAFRESDYLITKTGKTLVDEQEYTIEGKTESYYTIKFPLLDDKGRVHAVGGVSMNITERKLTEQLLHDNRQALEKQNRVLEIINEAQEQFIKEVEPSSLFKSTLGNILQLTNSELGFIGEILFDGEKTIFKLHAIETIDGLKNRRTKPVTVQIKETLLEQMVIKAVPFILDTAIDIQNIVLTGIDLPIQSFLGIPVLKGSRQVGVMGLANCPSGYSHAVVRQIQPLVGVLGSIIDAIRNEQQRKETEQNLRESEQRFRALADSAPVLIWMTGLDKKEIYYNKGFLEYIGSTMEEALQNGWISYLHEDDRKQSLEIYERSFDRENAFSIEYRLRGYDGQHRWFIDSGSPRYLPDGQFVGYIGTCTDIHERKLAEQSLLESEARYKSIVNDQQEMICRYVEGGILTFVNKSYANTFGLKVSELVGKSFSEFAFGETRDAVDFFIRNIFKNGAEVKPMEHALIINGKKRWQQWIHIPLLNDSGHVYEVQAIGKDVTKSKAIEAEQERLDKIVRESYNEIYLFHWDTFALEFANDAAHQNLGYSSSEIKQLRFSNLFNYPDEMALRALLNPLKRGETDRIEIQIKFNRKNGTYYDGETSIQVLERNASFVAITTDITQKITTEKKLLATILEKETLIKEIHHRVKNNLQLISSIIYIKLNALKDPELKCFLENTRQRIRSIALIHERLLQTQQLNKIQIADYLGKLVYDLRASNFGQHSSIEIKTRLEEHTLTLDSAIYCGLIVNELITNAIQHAFKDREKGVIEVEFKVADDNFILSVADDGRTLPFDIIPGQCGSFGMHLLEILTKQLRGSLEIIREKGTKFLIQFK